MFRKIKGPFSKTKKPAKKQPEILRYEELEQRLLFSADVVPGLDTIAVDEQVLVEDVSKEVQAEREVAPQTVEQTAAQARSELVLVNEDVADYEQLIADLQGSDNNRIIEVVVLDTDRDGIEQVSEILSERSDLAAVHFITHGADGQINLGNSRLTSTTLTENSDAVAGWGNALTETGDILFYGCNIATDGDGQTLLDNIAELIGADVAASDDLTGNETLGGDWELEYQQGEIEASVAISSQAQSTWSGVLTSFAVNNVADTADADPGNGVAQDVSGDTSLRAAIEEANALAGADIITLGAGTYTLSLGELSISSDVTITGAGAGVTVIDGDALSRVFNITSGTVKISDLTIKGGLVTAGLEEGGGITVASGASVTLDTVTITDNHATGAVTHGGGIFNAGELTVVNSTISGNSAVSGGGGLWNEGTADISRTLFVSNDISNGSGGGIYQMFTGSLDLTNVTLSGNTSTGNGGGIYSEGSVRALNITVTNNESTSFSAGGIRVSAGNFDMINSIVAGNLANTANIDFYGTVSTTGYNIIGDSTGSSGFGGTDRLNEDPLLGALADNGGATQTHALLAGSPAINNGDSAAAPLTDQLGNTRDASADIGAFEYGAAPILSISGADTAVAGSIYTLNLSSTQPGITSWTIDWGDGTTETIAGNPSTAAHTYNGTGFTYNILAAASDGSSTYFESTLLVPSYSTNDGLVRYEPTSGDFLQQFATGDGLTDPYEVIVGPDGNIYVGGYASDNVLRYDADGNFIDEFVTANSGGLDAAVGLAFGPDGNLYVSSYNTDSVLRYDGKTGAFIDTFALGGGLDEPMSVAFGADGNLYVVGFSSNNVVRYDGTTGAFIDVFVTAESGGLNSPEDMAFGPDGNLYITSPTSNEVFRYNGTTGAFIDVFTSGGSLNGATGLAFSPDGYLYVASYSGDNVLRFDATTGAYVDDYFAKDTDVLDGPTYLNFVPGHQVTVTNAVPTTITARETVDADADGQIDHIRITTDENLDDDFSGLSMAVSGYTVNGYTTNIGAGGANDNVFYAELEESGTPDTDATPWVTVEDNTSLGDADGNIAVEGEVNEFVFEAEEYTTHTSTDGIYNWELANLLPGYSGAGYLQAGPTDGFAAVDYTTDGAEVTYEFEVVTPGTYEVHFRTYSSGSGADSFYWGIDDVYVDQENTDTYGAWTWWTGDLNVNLTAGVHKLNIWMRESDQAIDQIVINQSATLPHADNTVAAEVARPGARSTDDAAPLITSDGGGATAAVNVAENTTAVTTVTATEPSSNFAITGGADSDKFDIDLNSGALTFKTAPDFESPTDVGPTDNVYVVEVTADDGLGNTDVQTINVTVTNVAPTTLTTTGTGSVSDGGLYTLNLSADEDVTSWTINWGDGTVETIAGNPSSATHTYSGAGITHNILVAATDADGTYLQNELLVPTYYGGEGVLRFAPTTGQFVEQLAMGDGLVGHFDVQQGPDGNLYVTGYNSGNVLRYAPDGSFINTFVSAGSGGLNNATSLLFGPDGHLYVAGADSVLRYDGANGTFIDSFVTSGSSGLSEPAGMAFGSDGNLYVASYNTHQVLRYNGSTGAFIDVFVSAGAGGLSSPEQITFGPDGNLYVANSGGDNVLRYNGTTGAFIDAFVATGAGGLDYTTGLAFGPDGNLYVTSQWTDNVLRYNGTTGAFMDEYVTEGAGGLDVPTYLSFLAEHQVTVTGSAAPVLSLPAAALNYTEGDGAVVVDSTATVMDPDSTDFDGGTLTVDFTANGTTNDRLAIRDQGTGIGNIQVSGSNISYQPGGSSILIGTFTGGTDGSTPLVITLNAAADSTAIQALMRNITYENVSNNPSTLTRTVRFVLTDGDGGKSTAVTETINVSAVNDDPTNEGSLPTDLVFLEDMQGKLNLSAIDLSDVDAGSGNLTLTIASANGHLQTLGWPGLTLGGSQSVLILTGNLTNLNDFLNDVNSIDYEHATPNMSGDNVDLITIEITDNGNTGSGGGGTITLGTVNIDVTAANDAPTAANNTVTTYENTTYTFSASDFNFSDIDGDTLASVKITSLETAGSLKLSGGDVTLNQVITKADIDASNLKFVPVADANGAGYDSFGFSVNDGTVDSATSYTMTIDVTAVNDAPTFIDGSVGNWNFDEGSGDSTVESAIGISTGTLGSTAGADANDPTWTTGKFDQALHFDGVNDYIEIADAPGIDISGPQFSASLWMNPDSGPNKEDMLFMKGDRQGNINYYLSWKDSGEMTWAFKDSAGWHYQDMPVTMPTTGQWNHIGITFDRPTVSLYVNGTKYVFDNVATGGSMDRDLTANDEVLWIGAGRDAGALVGVNQWSGPFTGSIDELALFDRALTDAEIEAIRTSTPPAVTASAFSINEKSANNTVVGTVVANDQDIGDTLSYTITAGNTGGAFSIDANGQIKVANSTALDFETNPTFNLTIEVDDGNGGTDSEEVTITLNDINDAPIARPDGVHLSFDGNDFVQVADATSLQMTNNVTIEAWINRDATDTGSKIIVNKEGEYELGITADTGEIKFAFAKQGTPDTWAWHNTGYFVTAGEWTHVAVTYDGVAGEAKTYINGELVDTLAQSGDLGDVYPTFNELWIGGRQNDPADRFKGQIDEVRVWSTTRTQGEIQASMGGQLTGGELGLAGNWRLDEAFGSVAVDQSASGNNNGVLGGSEGAAATPTYQGYFISEDSLLTVPAGLGLLANDFDADGDTLTVTNINTTGMLGSLVVNAADGSFTYDPRGVLDSLGAGERLRETFTYTANDGSVDSSPVTVTIMVVGVNDAPVNTVPGAQTVNEDTPLAFSGGALISVNDVDGNLASTQLSVTNGDLNVALSGSATISVGANGSSSLTISGSQTDINATLASLTYQGDLNFNGNDTLTVLSTDSAGTPLSDTDTVTITVDPINDAPAGANNTVSTPEDTDYVFAAANFGFTDPNDGSADNFANVIITTTVANGTLYVDANGNGVVDGGEALSDLDTVSVADISAGRLKFKPAANANGTNYDSFAFQLQDDGGGSDTDLTVNTMTINVTAVNDAAPVTGDDAYAVDEDNTLTADWWSTEWNRRQKLTFDNLAQAETLTDFPVLVILNSSNIDYAQTKDDGSDLRFFAADGTPLAHEIEQWNEGGNSSVWVRVPQITDNSNSDSIWMYYGNATAQPDTDAANVWDSNFVGVWHLNQEQSGTGNVGVYKDSTGTGNNGIDRIAATGQDGQITDGQEFGANDWIEIAHDASLDLTDSMTISFWIKPASDSGNFNRVVEKGLWGYQDSYYFGGGNGTNDLTFYLNGQEVFDTADNVLTVGEWQQATVSYTSNGDGTGSARLHINGVEVDINGDPAGVAAPPIGTYSGGPVDGNTGRLAIAHENGSYDFDGFIDEVQISNTDRSADWIAAQYQATKNQFGAEFVKFGGEKLAPAVGGVLSNDTDVDGDPLTVTLVDGPDNAQSFTLNKDGTFTYTPTANYQGSDSFTYEVSDGNGGTAQATATITVNSVNDAPSGADSTVSTAEDTDFVFAAGDFGFSDVNDSPANNLANIVIVTAPTNGTLYVDANNDGIVDGGEALAATDTVAVADITARWLKFKPVANANGTGYDSFTFKVQDDGGTANSGVDTDPTVNTITIDVTPVDDAAVITGDLSFSGNEGDTATGDLDATDVDGLTDLTYFSISAQGTNGTASIDAETGAWSYTPSDANWYGSDSFTVTVTDDLGGTTTQVVSISLANVNDAPTGSVTIDDTTPSEGQTLTAANTLADVDGMGAITYSWKADGAVVGTGATYTTTQSDVGKVITVEAAYTDGAGTAETVASAATAAVSNVDQPASISGDTSFSGNEGDTATGDLDATDVDGLTDLTYFSISAQGTNGTAAIDAETGAWSYTPSDANWYGSDSFTVTVTDDLGGTTTQVVSISLANVNDAPTGSVTIDDTTPSEGQTLTAANTLADVDGMGAITYSWKADGAVVGTGATYTTTQSDVGKVITVEAAYTDGAGTAETVASAATAAVSNVDQPASISGDTSFSGNEGDTATGDLDATDVDGLTDLTYFSISAQGTNGTAAIDAETGAWSYTPSDANWYGSDSFTVTVTDDLGGTTTQVVSISLANVNDAPTGSVTIDDTTPSEGQTLTAANTLADVDGMGAITYSWKADGAVVGTGATYTTTQSDVGKVITVEAAYTDGAGTAETVASAATAAVSNVDQPASITGDTSFSGNEGDTATGDLDATDVDGLTDLTYFSISAQGTNGTAAIDAETGAWSYTPSDANWYGSDSFTVTVTDDLGGTTTQVVSISLANVNDAPTGSVTIDDTTPSEGQTLTAANTLADVDGMGAITYSWKADGAVVGTGATYTTTQSDVGKVITVEAAYTDGAGTAETVASAATAAVSNVDQPASITGDTSYSGNEGDTATGDLDATDVDGLTDLTYFSISAQGTNGTAAIDAETGAWSYTPSDANWYGSDSFTVTVTDDLGGTTTQVVSISLANVNDAPTGSVTIDDTTPTEGQTLTAANTLADVDGIGAISYSWKANGVEVGTGATYTTTQSDVGRVITVEASYTDGAGTAEMVASAATAAVGNVDQAAVISGDTSYAGNEGETPSGTLSATDADGLTDNTYFSISSQGANGTASIDAESGAWSFTPSDSDWYGSDSFEVTVTDDLGGTTTQVITIDLANVNDAPTGSVTISDTTPTEGQTLTAANTLADVDGMGAISYTWKSDGAVVGTGATYTTTQSDVGKVITVEAAYTDGAGTAETVASAATAAVTNVDQPASITGDTSFSGNEGDTATGDLDATDVDGLTDTTYFTISAQGSNGTAAIDAESGAWTFTPTDPNWFGSDAFTVTVTDDLGGTTTQVVNITLANVDDAAVISGDISFTGNEGDAVSGTMGATDVEGLTDSTYFSVTGAATNGTAAIDPASGAWTFTPTDPNWFGTDAFTVTVTDDLDGTTTQVVNITLANVDDTAVISGDISFTGNEGDAVSGTMGATDVDGLTDGTYFSVTAAATNGTAAIDPASGAWTFTPTDPNWFGSDAFTVTVTDDLGGTTTQVVNITLANVDDTAVISGDISFTGNEGDAVSGTMAATDADGLTDGTYFSVTTPATNGTAAIDATTGAWTFTPTDPNWFGTDAFTVTVTDDLGGTTTQLVNITLANVDDAAVVTGDLSYTGNEGDAVAGDLNATDVDGLTDTTYFTVTTSATNGSAVIDAETGAWTFTPTDPNWFGSDAFTVTVTDDLGGTTTQVVNITLANVDDSAVITGDISFTGNEGDAVAGDLNATDVDGLTDTTYFTVSAQGSNGTAAIDPASGAWTFTPTDPNWFGSDSFTVTVTDDLGGTTTQVVSITLANVNDAPSAAVDSVSGNEDTAVVDNILGNDSDVDGDALTTSAVSGPNNGSLTLNADGSFSYTPNANWNGTDSFTYTANDGALDSNVATVTITVNPVNDVPTVTSSAVTEASEDAAYSYTITTGDIDGDAMTITAPVLPTWLTLVDNGDGTATLSGTPTNAEVGDHSVVLQVSDSSSTDTQNFTLNVTEATIDPPVDGGIGTDPGPIFEDPEPDDDDDSDDDVPTYEEPAEDPQAEDVPVPLVDLIPEDSSDADDSFVLPNDPDAQETDEIIYLTDEDDTDLQSEEREDDQSYKYFDNDFYKEIISAKYLNFNSNTPENTQEPGELADSGVIDFASDDWKQVVAKEDYILLREEIDETFSSEQQSNAVKAKIVTASMTTFTVGIASYFLRAGSMVSSLMSSLPLWRGFDPIAIFAGKKKRKKDRNEIPNTDKSKSETLFDGEAE